MSKAVSKENEQLTYVMSEADVKSRAVKPCLFPTFYFDDVVKVEVAHKNSHLKGNSIGKGTVEMKDLAYAENGPTVIGLPIVSKRDSISHISGYLYLRVSYKNEQI